MRQRLCLPAALILLLTASSASAVGTAFTYQGTLEDAGAPANGLYDLQFRALSPGGLPVGPTLTINDATLVNGVFTVQLDFGAGVFTGADRVLEIGIRPGAATGSYTVLAPNTPINPAPYAQVAANALVADVALSVPDNSIQEADIATGAVSSRAIASNSVGTTELAVDSVTASRITAGAVGTSEIADGTVDEIDLADGAITNLKLASGNVLPSRLAGQFGTYSIAMSVGGNSCIDLEVPVGGDVNANDLPLVSLAAGSSLPADMSLTALRVTADNSVLLRACNFGNSAVNTGNFSIRLITFR